MSKVNKLEMVFSQTEYAKIKDLSQFRQVLIAFAINNGVLTSKRLRRAMGWKERSRKLDEPDQQTAATACTDLVIRGFATKAPVKVVERGFKVSQYILNEDGWASARELFSPTQTPATPVTPSTLDTSTKEPQPDPPFAVTFIIQAKDMDHATAFANGFVGEFRRALRWEAIKEVAV